MNLLIFFSFTSKITSDKNNFILLNPQKKASAKIMMIIGNTSEWNNSQESISLNVFPLMNLNLARLIKRVFCNGQLETIFELSSYFFHHHHHHHPQTFFYLIFLSRYFICKSCFCGCNNECMKLLVDLK